MIRSFAAFTFRYCAPIFEFFRFIYKWQNLKRYKNPQSGRYERFLYMFSNKLDNFDYTILNKSEIITQICSFFGETDDLNVIDRFNDTKQSMNSGSFFGTIKDRNFVLYALIQTFQPTLILDLGTKSGNSARIACYAIHDHLSATQSAKIISVDIDRLSGKYLSKFDCIEAKIEDSVNFLEALVSLDSRVIIHSDSMPKNKHIVLELKNALKNVRGEFLFIHNSTWSNANSEFEARKSSSFELYEIAQHSIYPGRSLSVGLYKSIMDSKASQSLRRYK